MNLGRLTQRAKRLVEKRGGTDALREDAQELGDIVKGKGSAGDKAKAAAGALKDPGAPGKEPKRRPQEKPAPKP